MQPPEGPPVCTALKALSPAMPPAISKIISLKVIPKGISTRPVLLTLPTRAKTVVPGLPLVPYLEYHWDPRAMIGAMWDQVLTLLIMVGLPHKPLWAGNGGRGRGSPTLPSMEAMSEVSSPQTKAPAPSRIFSLKEKLVPKMLSPRRPSFSA